jgi:hypothetical protein
MEIVEYGVCHVVNLMNMVRPSGAAYFPEIAAKVITKYQFAKPPTIDDIDKEVVKFQIGKFNNVQIAEFAVYGDGVIANGKCPTEVLEAFLSDVLALSTKELGLVPILSHRSELHFESTITVQTKADIGAFVASPAQALISKTIQEKIGVGYQASGIALDCDARKIQKRRKPARVFVERKLGFPFAENLFYCIAPLRTADHIELLKALETEALNEAARKA